MKHAKARPAATAAKWLLYLVFLLCILFPLYWVFTMALKTFGDIIAVPPKLFNFAPTLDNFKNAVFTGAAGSVPEFVRYVGNSVITTVSAVALSLLLGLPAAYSLTRKESKFNSQVSFQFMSYRFAPELMVVLPLYSIFKKAGLYDTFAGLILVHQLITLPLIIWIMMGFFREVPRDMENAAKIDGAGPYMVFLRVMLPVVKQGIASATIIAFIFSWNNLLFGLIMSGGSTMPVTMGILQTMTFDQIKWGEMAACAVVSMVPGILISVFCQRFLVKGLTMGAIK